MASEQADRGPDIGSNELKKLRGELWILAPFALFCGYVFVTSFSYKFQAAAVPTILGLATLVLVALRLFHVAFPGSRIGRFSEAGLAGEFDHIKEEIEEETLKGKCDEEPSKLVTFGDERKAFIALTFSCALFVLFGYGVGSLLVILTTSYFYGYRKLGPILLSAGAMFVLLFLVLHRVFGAEMSWGLLLTPVLTSLDLI